MTVINAIKFNNHSGAMCCDEQTTIGDVRKMMSSDKIQMIVPDEIKDKLKLEAAYGGTGTTAIGDEIRRSIKLRLQNEYENLLAKSKENIDHFKTIDEIAQIGFEEMMKVKHRHIDDIVKGYFNFNTVEYTQGFYLNMDGEKIDLNQNEVKDRVYRLMNWQDSEDVNSIFLNAAIVCGFDYMDEFKIFKLSMKREMNCEPAPSIFETVGSGSDTSQIIFSDYTGRKTLDERRFNIDKVEGMIQLIRATNAAAKFNMGVGGYFNIIIFNAKEEENRLFEIYDSRAKLASEIVYAYQAGFLSDDKVYELIKELIFKSDKTFEELNTLFLKYSKSLHKMSKFLRGYKM
jgi:hypothetical protein